MFTTSTPSSIGFSVTCGSTWVFLYPSVARYPSSYLRVQETAPSLVSQSQSPSLVSQSQNPPTSSTYGSTPGSPSTSQWRGTSLATFESRKQPPVWYLKARAPSLVSQSQSPPTFVSTAGSPSPSPWCGPGNSPQSGISKPEPPLPGLPLLVKTNLLTCSQVPRIGKS